MTTLEKFGLAALAACALSATLPSDPLGNSRAKKVEALLTDPYALPLPPITQPPKSAQHTLKKVETIIPPKKN